MIQSAILSYPIEYKAYKNMLKEGSKAAAICDSWVKGNKSKTGFECFFDDLGPAPFNQYKISLKPSKTQFSKANSQWSSKFVNVTYPSYDTVQAMCQHYNINKKKNKNRLQKTDILDIPWINTNILALDPGTKNFAFTCIRKGKVSFSGMLSNTVHDITGKQLSKKVSEFLIEFENLLDKAKPNLIVVERFMLRLFGTKLIELVAIMLGMIAKICHLRGIEIILLTSSQWKLSAKKHIDLKALYKEGKAKYKLPPHPIDAMCMARYFMSGNNYRAKDLLWLKRNLRNCVKQLD